MSFGDALLVGLGIIAALVVVFVVPPWARTLRDVFKIYKSRRKRARVSQPQTSASNSVSVPLAGFPRTTEPEMVTSPTPLSPLEPEEEPTDLVVTGVPMGHADAPTANAEPQIVLRDVSPEAESNEGLHQSQIRSLQIDDGPIVSLMTTEE